MPKATVAALSMRRRDIATQSLCLAKAALMANILIVEDHPDLAYLFTLWVKLAGHAVQTCQTGFQALQAVRDFRPIAVLLDLGLPGMEGWQVAEQIRRNQEIEQPKLIAISAYHSEEDLERSTRSGIDLDLPKPIDLQTFREVMKTIALDASVQAQCTKGARKA